MTGTRRPAPWPRYALWALEDATADLLTIEALARDALEALKAGRMIDAVILLGDVRNKAMDARNTLHKGKEGER